MYPNALLIINNASQHPNWFPNTNKNIFMFKTSKSIIMPKLNLSFELFIIMISITKEQQLGITYFMYHGILSLIDVERGTYFKHQISFDARSDFDLGYMKACKGFGLFTTTWVVMGVALSIPLIQQSHPYLHLTLAAPTGHFLLTYFLFLLTRFMEWSGEQIFTHDFQNLVFILPVLKVMMMTRSFVMLGVCFTRDKVLSAIATSIINPS